MKRRKQSFWGSAAGVVEPLWVAFLVIAAMAVAFVAFVFWLHFPRG
jgi:hypothetical protein